jgi:hypothetical protein
VVYAHADAKGNTRTGRSSGACFLSNRAYYFFHAHAEGGIVARVVEWPGKATPDELLPPEKEIYARQSKNEEQGATETRGGCKRAGSGCLTGSGLRLDRGADSGWERSGSGSGGS